MKKTIRNIIAFDCGNSSSRVVLGQYDGNKITMEMISQAPNDMVNIQGYYYWDLLSIYEHLMIGLKKALHKVKKIDSIGICTWGIDFALFDKNGFMLNNPLSYRNVIGEKYLNQLTEEEKETLYLETGILCDKINSIYMLRGMRDNMPEIYKAADKLLMIPDILNYMITGNMYNEPSEFSTTQLMDSRTRKLSSSVCKRLDIDPKLFSELSVHGTKIGNLLPGIKDYLGIDYDIPVICVPSHDTASAVLAIPAEEEQFAFISSGTWSLIGTELNEPIISSESLESGLTNEVGAFQKITLLKNNAGMFIIQRIKKEYEEYLGRECSWSDIIELATSCDDEILLFDVNSNRFFNPNHMANEIYCYLTETGQISGKLEWGKIMRSVYESLVSSYAVTIRNLERVTGRQYESVYIVGGGSRNAFVNKLIAKKTGKKVIACSQEGTSIGNIATQIKYFEKEKTLSDIRKVIRNSINFENYIERGEAEDIAEC